MMPTLPSFLSLALVRRPLVKVSAVVALFLILSTGTLLPPASARVPQQLGSWSSVINAPIVPIHVSVLPIEPAGRLLFWNANYAQGGLAAVYVYDLGTGMMSDPLPIPSGGADPNNLFCAGHSFLANGKLLVTGGHLYISGYPYYPGIDYTNIFDPFTGAYGEWLPTMTLPRMNAGRWYPTNVTLADGKVLVATGNDRSGAINQIPQVWMPDASGNNGSWQSLPGAEFPLPLYAWLHVAPDSRVFSSGPGI